MRLIRLLDVRRSHTIANQKSRARGRARVADRAGVFAVAGETGAGKSIIIGALQLLLGERADLKQQPAAKARLRLAVAQRG